MFIREAVTSVGRRLFGEKELGRWEDNFLVQFLFLTTIKNYFYSWSQQQTPFIVPNQVKHKALRNKIVLVLDMDETLVHTRNHLKPTHSNYIATQFKGENMYVETRPLAAQFLRAVSEIFTVYIYTAGEKKYADTVLNIIDPERLIEKRFYRDSCRKQEGIWVKDLKHLKRSLRTKQEMVLVDDNTLSVEKNYPFALQVEPFEGNQQDRELLQIFQQLLKFYI